MFFEYFQYIFDEHHAIKYVMCRDVMLNCGGGIHE